MRKELPNELLAFARKYSTPVELGLDGLFRFSSFDSSQLMWHKKLLKDGWLFHNTPKQFNDPFECKPSFCWPSSDSRDFIGFKEDVLFLQNLIPEASRKEVSCDTLLQDEALIKRIRETISSIYQQFRLCCFTKSNKNLLFWSHYADSHTGYCIRLCATGAVASNARKVNYSERFPTLKFPLLTDMKKLIEPILNKSIEWGYEDEYRSIFAPFADYQLPNDGESLSLSEDIITDIYFGANMKDSCKKELVKLVQEGPFKPNFWNGELAPTEFKVIFVPYS